MLFFCTKNSWHEECFKSISFNVPGYVSKLHFERHFRKGITYLRQHISLHDIVYFYKIGNLWNINNRIPYFIDLNTSVIQSI